MVQSHCVLWLARIRELSKHLNVLPKRKRWTCCSMELKISKIKTKEECAKIIKNITINVQY